MTQTFNNLRKANGASARNRHLGEAVKIGLGDNFGHFSVELTGLAHDDLGISVYSVGKF